MPRWLELALSGSVVRRGLKFALIVGTVLVSINHGDAILAGEINSDRLLRIGLTVMVPYMVSTISSVAALLEQE